MKLFDLREGDAPLIFSVPHAGTLLPEDVAARLTPRARKLPDTDWHVDELYDFAPALGAGMIRANYSRYVIDLNRPPQDESLYPGQATTGLCPGTQFDGTPIYADGIEVAAEEVERRRELYWRPYHRALAKEIERLKGLHGFVLLYDCHSIASRVPRLFDGSLPDLNLGTVDGTSCDAGLEAAVVAVMERSGLSSVANGRFVGGYITRAYGKPVEGIHGVQMELGQDCHLRDGTTELGAGKAQHLRAVLREICEAMIAWASAAKG